MAAVAGLKGHVGEAKDGVLPDDHGCTVKPEVVDALRDRIEHHRQV